MSELLVEDHGDVELWLLNRPSRRNALSLALLDRLDAARVAATKANRRAVVLASHSDCPTFCAGFDLDDLRRLAAAGASTEAAASRLHDVFAALESAPFLLVTAIRGAAIGGGCELALLGEVRLSHPDSTFTLPPAKLGVVYPEVGLARLATALGAAMLGAMLATASPVSAQKLESMGVLWKICENPVVEALELAKQVAALSADSLRGNRDSLRRLARG